MLEASYKTKPLDIYFAMDEVNGGAADQFLRQKEGITGTDEALNLAKDLLNNSDDFEKMTEILDEKKKKDDTSCQICI